MVSSVFWFIDGSKHLREQLPYQFLDWSCSSNYSIAAISTNKEELDEVFKAAGIKNQQTSYRETTKYPEQRIYRPDGWSRMLDPKIHGKKWCGTTTAVLWRFLLEAALIIFVLRTSWFWTMAQIPYLLSTPSDKKDS